MVHHPYTFYQCGYNVFNFNFCGNCMDYVGQGPLSTFERACMSVCLRDISEIIHPNDTCSAMAHGLYVFVPEHCKWIKFDCVLTNLTPVTLSF